jgi:sugar phosphate isomerase/epimerase
MRAAVPEAPCRLVVRDVPERKFDVMAELGAPMMLVCSNVASQAIDDDERAGTQLHALAERAATRGLRIAYEALAWARTCARTGTPGTSSSARAIHTLG